MKRTGILATAVVMFGSVAMAAPIRVFVLTGQSNMEGKGTIKHLEELVSDPATADDYKHLKKGGSWTERDDVWIKYFDRKGMLTVGYGNPPNRIGPELGFGQVRRSHQISIQG